MDRVGAGKAVKTREEDNVQIQERGEIFIFYRPKVSKEEADSPEDVQRLYLVLRPDPGEDGRPMRLIVMGQKSLSGKKGRPHWGFVDLVTTSIDQLKSALQAEEYETSTRGHRQKPAARALGEGVYRLLKHHSHTKHQMHTHLVYKLQPHTIQPDENPPPQELLNIRPEASFLIQIKNPASATNPRFRGLQSKRKAAFPAHLLALFGNRRFTPADPPEFLNYQGCELLLIPASDDIQQELGLDLKTESELRDEQDEEDVDECSSFVHTFGEDSGLPTTPLFQGTWA